MTQPTQKPDTPSIELLHELFDLNPETGVLIRKACARGDMGVGGVAGSIASNGYRVVEIKRRGYKVHRIVFAMTHGRWPTNQIDHINGDKLDNRPANLREATGSENMRNRGPNRNNSFGMKGVYWHPSSRKYGARIYVNRKAISLGVFDTPEAAAAAYEQAAPKIHGEFARTV